MSWRLAYRNLLRNKRRSLSTGLAICVGFVALNLLGAYIYRSQRALTATSIYLSQRGHFVIYRHGGVEGFQNKPKKFILQNSEIEELKKSLSSLWDKLEYTSTQLSSPALLSNGNKSHPIMAYGFDPAAFIKSLQQRELLDWAHDWVLPWQRENSELYRSSPDMISVTPLIADIMSLKRPLTSNESVQIAARNLDGDLNAINADLGAEHTTGQRFLEDTVVLVPIAKMQELLATEGVESLSLYVRPGVDLSSFETELRSRTKSLPFPVDVFRYDDEAINAMYKGTMDFLYVMGAFFVFLICTAVSLTIVNSLTMGIIERTREIGTLRAIGFKSKHIRQIFSKEALLISFISMVMGTWVSFVIAGIVNALNIQFQPPGVSQKIQFMLIWNLQIAAMVAVLLTSVTWISARIVISRKSRTKLILLLHDIGESA